MRWLGDLTLEVKTIYHTKLHMLLLGLFVHALEQVYFLKAVYRFLYLLNPVSMLASIAGYNKWNPRLLWSTDFSGLTDALGSGSSWEHRHYASLKLGVILAKDPQWRDIGTWSSYQAPALGSTNPSLKPLASFVGYYTKSYKNNLALKLAIQTNQLANQ